MTTRDEADLACRSLEATIRSHRAEMNKMSLAGAARERRELALEDLEAMYDEAHSALAEGIYFADGRFRHPVDLTRAEQKWARAVAIVNEALAVAA